MNKFELQRWLEKLLQKKGMARAVEAHKMSAYCEEWIMAHAHYDAGGLNYYPGFKERADKILRQTTQAMSPREMDQYHKKVGI